MSAGRRIAVYWSPGRSLESALETMAQCEPDARLCAIVPPAYPLSESERLLARDFIHADEGRYTFRHPWPLLRWMRRLRRERFDLLIVLFDSPRLIAMAGAARPRKAACLLPNRVLLTVPASLPGAMALLLARRLKGFCVYALIGLTIHLSKTRLPAIDETDRIRKFSE